MIKYNILIKYSDESQMLFGRQDIIEVTTDEPDDALACKKALDVMMSKAISKSKITIENVEIIGSNGIYGFDPFSIYNLERITNWVSMYYNGSSEKTFLRLADSDRNKKIYSISNHGGVNMFYVVEEIQHIPESIGAVSEPVFSDIDTTYRLYIGRYIVELLQHEDLIGVNKGVVQKTLTLYIDSIRFGHSFIPSGLDAVSSVLNSEYYFIRDHLTDNVIANEVNNRDRLLGLIK